MATVYDQELLEALSNFSDIEVIGDPGPYFKLIEERFPIAMNRVDWSAKANHRFLDLQGLEANQKLTSLRSFVEELEAKSEDQYVVVIGDGAQENAYRFELSILKHVIGYFTSMPQHVFVLFEKSGACLNYTFEDELFFGQPKL